MTPHLPPAAPLKPIIQFDPSQRRFFNDPARIIAVNWHRQKGKDFTAAGKAVASAVETRQSWYIVAMTQAQADETFAKCVKVADLYKKLLKRMYGTDELRTEAEEFYDYDREIDEAFRCSARILHLPGGGRVVSLPGRDPDTLAGRSGNLILTEFGLYPKGGYPHWDVLFPIITRGGFRLVVISTPRGKNTKFYEVCQNAEGFYSYHFCDLRKSVHEDGYQLFDAMGQPLPSATPGERDAAIATFRRMYNSESKWAREYECQFTGDLSSLVTWAEIERAAELGRGLPFDLVEVKGDAGAGGAVGAVWEHLRAEARAGAAVSVGWDIARTSNVSALAVNFQRPGRPRHLRFVVSMRGVPFREQRAFAQACMDLSWSAAGYGDATGMGRESNEELGRANGGGSDGRGGRWTPFLFTAPGKREVASSLKTGFVDGTQTLPPLDGPHKFIATDVYAVQKDDTGGQLVLEETPNPLCPDSHCDYAYALGLGRLAGSKTDTAPLPPPLMHKPAAFSL